MAVAIPLVMAYGAVASGAVAGLAAYATVAGAVLSTVGALDGNKDLQKLGSVLQLGSAIYTGFSGAAGAGASGGAAADAAAADAAGGMVPQFGSQAAYDAGIGNVASEAAGQAVNTGALGRQAAGDTLDTMYGAPGDVQQEMAGGPLFNRAASNQVTAAGTPSMYGGAETNPDALSHFYGGNQAGGASALDQQASTVNSSDFSKWLDNAMGKAGSALKQTGKFVEANKELVSMGGNAVNSMYGPQARLAQIQQDQLNYQRGLMERARANINAPVALRYNRG
jgi:hypothetical protein